MAVGTGEVEQPVGDIRGTEALTFDLLEQVVMRIALREPLQQHLGIGRDPGERRVHLMSHSGGQQADGGQALLLHQRLLLFCLLGDVIHRHHPVGAALRGAQRREPQVHQALVRVAGQEGLLVEAHHLVTAVLQRAQDDGRETRVEDLVQRQPQAVLARDAGELAHGAIPAHHPAFLVQHQDPHLAALQDPLVEVLEALDLVGALPHLAEQACTLHRHRGMPGHRLQQVEVLGVQGPAVTPRPGGQQCHQ